MRLSALATRLVVFAAAAGLSMASARTAATFIEERSLVGVREVLIDQGHDWASVVSDGLQVVLEGQAPSEAMRFRFGRFAALKNLGVLKAGVGQRDHRFPIGQSAA